jgi:hypothetical protein
MLRHGVGGRCAGREGVAVQNLLVDLGVPTLMKVWALSKAAQGEWQEPSQNFHDGVSTAEVTVEIRRYENQRSYNQAVPDLKHVQEAECCWAEGYQLVEFNEETEQLCDDAVYDFCTTPLY